MIQTEQIIINGNTFVRTYSDCGMMIERDGMPYEDAIDPIGIDRTYIETTIPAKGEEISAEEFLAMTEELL